MKYRHSLTGLIAGLIFITTSTVAQTAYQKAWQRLDEADLPTATEEFEKARKDSKTHDQAEVLLCMIKGRVNQPEEAHDHLMSFLNRNENPLPVAYALWSEPGVAGEYGKKKPYQQKFMEAVAKHPQTPGRLDGAVTYRLGASYIYRFDAKKAHQYYERLNEVKNWSLLGPFDNVMNSGFHKSEGALEHPEKEHSFTSNYGANIRWFTPNVLPDDGYMVKSRYFLHDHALMYAQSFVEALEDREVLVKLGFSGSAKFWVNDQLLLSEPEPRNTEMDYYTFRCRLKKGYNRLLIKLGDYQTNYPNFIVRMTDLEHQPLDWSTTADPKPYVSGDVGGERMPFFATAWLENMCEQHPDDRLYPVLLAKCYMRSKELDRAEAILLELHEQEPKNFFVLRNLILLYTEAGNNTEQNRFYSLFEENYPHFRTILANQIEEYQEQKNLSEVKMRVEQYNELYPDEYQSMLYRVVIAGLEEDYNRIIQIIDSLYNLYPDDYYAVSSKYQLSKALDSDGNLDKILEQFLKDNYNYEFIQKLASSYIEAGKTDKALALYRENLGLLGYDPEMIKVMVAIYTRRKDYDNARGLCHRILHNRPSDYHAMDDLATFHMLEGHKDSARYYYEKALEHFPFSFEYNEKVQFLETGQTAMDQVPTVKPKELISDFEDRFQSSRSKDLDIVLDQKTVIMYRSKAMGISRKYLVRLNTESALEDFQQLNFAPDRNMETTINDVKTIKANGNEILAERNGYNAVLLNLEVGDYVYVDYKETQVTGGRSSFYLSDRFALRRPYPAYRVEYNLLVEQGLAVKDTVINGTVEPSDKELENFTWRQYLIENQEPVADERYAPAFADISTYLHVSLDYKWDDIIQWYSDLSDQQAVADHTIEKLSRTLFSEGTMSDREKAQKIYDFVCKNIQYSSIDFRQSSYVPQKASDVYHSRLGDCKDVSTLYVSLARAAGLNANLVLINTRNNGQYDVLLPSLNFNHCIVKVLIDNKPVFLELTDPNLPFGHLQYYHQGAAILEIPTGGKATGSQLAYLDFNSGFSDKVVRHSTVSVDGNGNLSVRKQCLKTGARAAGVCESYYSADEKDRFEKMQKSIAGNFDSKVSLKSVQFEQLEPLSPEVKYHYEYEVEQGVKKLGSFRSVKLPFSDVLAHMGAFEDGLRETPFDFNQYENTDLYEEQMVVKVDPGYELLEIPEDVKIDFHGFRYTLTFSRKDAHTVHIRRVYEARRKYVPSTNYEELRNFIAKVVEAENAEIVMKQP